MNDKDIKEIIPISKDLDSAILKGFERGKKERNSSRFNIKRKGVVAAGVVFCLAFSTAVIKPEIVSAVPGVGRFFESFNNTLLGKDSKEIQNLAQNVGVVSESNGIKVTLDQAVLEENKLLLGLTCEGDFLNKNSDKGDYLDIMGNITVDGQLINTYNPSGKKLTDTKGNILIEADVSSLTIKENAKVEVNIIYIRSHGEDLKGEWNLSAELKKGADGKKVVLNKEVELNGYKLKAETLTMSSLGSTLTFSGVDNTDIKNFVFSSSMLAVKDENGKVYKGSSGGRSNDLTTGEFNSTYKFKEDLSKCKTLEIIPIGNSNVSDVIDGKRETVLASTGNTTDEKIKKFIKRKPTEKELNDGYGFPTKNYNIELNKNMEFYTLDQLKGKEIMVNSNEIIKIVDIMVSSNKTKVIFESKGNYSYENFGQMAIFDENLLGVNGGEGEGAAIEDFEKGLYSMTIGTAIDTNGRYIIAIPKEKEITFQNPKWKMDIRLN